MRTTVFFDRSKIMRRTDAMRRRWLVRAAGTIRVTAQNRIKKQKTSSAPGHSPSGHTDKLKRNIRFWINGGARSAKIGPALLPSHASKGRPVSGTIPDVLEFGGVVLQEQKDNKSYPSEHQRDRAATLKHTRIQPRPFMRPALDTHRSKLPGMMRGEFNKG